MSMPMEVQPDPVVVHADPNCIRVRHRAYISKKFKRYLFCLGCNFYGCYRAEEALKRTYFEVHENRIEFNYPIPTLCCTIDAVDVLHFDRDFNNNVGKAGFCSPPMTHMQCFPTCCDICGEGVVVYSNQCNCYKPAMLSAMLNGGGCLCNQFLLFLGFTNAMTVVEEIIRAKNDWLVRVGPAAGLQMK